jgi:palmitoyl-protein thioesterase
MFNQTRLILNDTDIVYLTEHKPILYNPSTKHTQIYTPLYNPINFTNVSLGYDSYESDYPTVLMHGILANADNLNELKEMLEMNFKIKVFNLEIGDGAHTSIYTDMQSQLKMLCEKIYSIDDLKDGFNFIGMSQGGLLARGYVQYCNKYPVKNLITLVSPNAGVFYQINFANNFYEPEKQKELSLTNYWRDPYRYETYLTNSTYLAKLNHEVKRVSLYMIQENDLDVLDNFVMIWSPNDEIIEPPESGKFSMYEVVDDKLEKVELVDSELYQNDFLKLKSMNEENRLYTYETDCKHSQHKDPECFHQLKHIFEKFLI